jgi:hypothetical protein
VTARRAIGLLALALALLAPAPGARAGDEPVTCSLESRGGRLVARLDLSAAFPDDLRRTFGNGLTNVVALHVALVQVREDGEATVALFGREVDVLYDVWEETFAVTVKDPQSPRGRRLTARTWAELRGLLADAHDLDLVPAAELGEGPWLLRTRVEVNPVSKELLQRTREFIANPSGGVRTAAPSRSVLGAMASYLLQAGDAGEARQFHTRPFTAREVVKR